MAISTIYRYTNHDDHQHAARVNGINAGYGHANYVDAYGATPETTVPDGFTDVADVWESAYREGKDDYAASEEEEETYGHDWRG